MDGLTGALGDGSLAVAREMSRAMHQHGASGVGHGALMAVETWERETLWRFVDR